LPSLLGPGSKPMQLFGLRKTPALSHAPRQALMAFEHERAQIQRRAVGENRPFACSGTLSAHKSAKETVNTIACGNAGCPGATVVTNARATYSTRAAAGATGTRHSPRPLIFRGEGCCTTRAPCAARRRRCVLTSLRPVGSQRRLRAVLKMNLSASFRDARSADPESRDFPMRNCALEVRCFASPRNDDVESVVAVSKFESDI